MKLIKSRAMFSSTAVALLVATSFGTVQAQDDLLFPVGEGDFNWDSYNGFAEANDLDGQSLTVFGPWLSADQEFFYHLCQNHRLVSCRKITLRVNRG